MKIDVIYVTYNSEKWIRPLLSSWEKEESRGSVNLIIVDNGSTDKTVDILEEIRREKGDSFASFCVISEKENHGFGLANNIGAAHGTGSLICFFNVDTEIQEGTLSRLFQYIDQSPSQAALWELRQFPFEHPKYYDPVTLETSWCSGAAFVIRRKVFEEIGGFDPHFFMYAEDVDLSWRARAAGYKIIYCPGILIRHSSYCKRGEIKPLQYGYSMRNNLLMRRRYGTAADVLGGWILLLKLLLTNGMGRSFNRVFLKIVVGYFRERKYFLPAHHKTREAFFHGLNYSKMRYGGFHETGLIRAKNVEIWTFVLSGRPENISDVRRCLINETRPSQKIQVIENLAQAADSLNGVLPGEPVWINIICSEQLVFADHNEALAELAEKGCSVVGTVDEHGQKGRSLSYYLFHIKFYQSNRSCFLENRQDFLVEKCSGCCRLQEKQTVVCRGEVS